MERIKHKPAVDSTGVLDPKSVHFQPVNPTFLFTDPAVTSVALVKPVESEIMAQTAFNRGIKVI